MILDIKLIKLADEITLSQSRYIENCILENYDYSNCIISSTPYIFKIGNYKEYNKIYRVSVKALSVY